jgi:hypothetical protein
MPAFQRRHYEALAKSLQASCAYDVHAYPQWLLDCEAIAYMLAADNPRFNRARFLAACEEGANVKARKP